MPYSAALQISECALSVQVLTFLTVTGFASSLLVETGLGWIGKNAGVLCIILNKQVGLPGIKLQYPVGSSL